MTTETPDSPQPPLMDVAEVYRTLGRLEEGQSQFKDQLVRHEERNERQFERIEHRFARLESRIDRLMLALFAIGATMIAGFGGIILQNALSG